MQFAVKLEVFISRGPNRKMVGEFRVICRNGGLDYFGGIHGFLVFTIYANGANFVSFII